MKNNLSIAMDFAGIPAVKLAEKMSVTLPYISQLTSGIRKLGHNNLQAYAEALDVSPAWLSGEAQSLPIYDPIERQTIVCKIVREEEIPDYGMLYHVYVDESGDVVPVVISSGLQFVPADWQGWAAKEVRAVKDLGNIFCDWIDVAGHPAIVMDGLPRMI